MAVAEELYIVNGGIGLSPRRTSEDSPHGGC